MKCFCETELIHGGDHDCEEDEDFLIVSNLSCPNCGTFVLVYTPKEGLEMVVLGREIIKYDRPINSEKED